MPVPFVDPLERVSTARSLLEQANTVDEIARLVQDQREQWKLYLAESNDSKAIKLVAAEIEIRSQRRMGEMLLDTRQENGGPVPSTKREARAGKTEKQEAIDAFGMTSKDAWRAEKIAAMPEERFENYIEQKREQRRPATVNEILRMANLTEADLPSREKTPVEKAFDSFRQYTRLVRLADPEEGANLLTEDWEKSDGAVARGNIALWREVAAWMVASADLAERRMSKKIRVVKGAVSA